MSGAPLDITRDSLNGYILTVEKIAVTLPRHMSDAHLVFIGYKSINKLGSKRFFTLSKF
jgi:hypothetical protein